VNNKLHTGDTGYTTLPEARKELIKLKAEWIREGNGIKTCPTFNKAIQLWADSRKMSVTEEYITLSLAKLNLHISPYIGLMKCNKITKTDIQKCLTQYLEATQAGKTIINYGGHNKLIELISHVFHFLQDDDYITSYKLPKRIKTQEKKYNVLDTTQIKTLFVAIETEYSLTRAVTCALCCYCGLRISEATHLKWSNIDWIKKEFVNDKTKAKEAKTIHMPDDLIAMLRRLQISTQELKTGYILSGTEPLKRNTLDWTLRRMGLKLFKMHISPHTLRASYITNIYIETKDIVAACECARHSSIAQTKHYINTNEDLKKSAVASTFSNKKEA
jgi:integrase